MSSASRLERARKLVQGDVNSLPDRTYPQGLVEDTDNEDTGGVSLQEPQETIVTPGKSAVDESSRTPAGLHNKPNTDHRFVLLKDKASSYNARTMRPSNVTPKAPSARPTINLQRGEVVPVHRQFTPIQAAARFPYRFCNKTSSQDIASAFFDQGKFWAREWDLYYIWDVEPTKPLILVCETQFQDLLDKINTHLKLGLVITNSQREEGLVSRFPDHPDCLPRYLGRSHSREQYDNMVNNAPDKEFRIAGERAHAPLDNRTLEQFKQQMEELWDVQKAKNKARKELRLKERLGRQMSMVDQLKRAQRYLGLRASESMENTASSGKSKAIDASLPCPFTFEKSVVFVCVDVESYERAHHKITEVGIATLDTRDLVGVAPGRDGEHWRSMIKARHFRIKENCHLVNSQFVSGHPDGFEFGESTFVTLKEAPAHVAACFRQPFGVHASNTDVEEIENMLPKLNFDENRTVVFLGHDTSGDIRYLQQLGFDPLKQENITEAMDTAKMYQAWRRDQQPTNLGKILFDFDIVAWKLHNAGNDAMYTVQVMLATCVREATVRGTSELETMREDDKTSRRTAAHDAAEERVREDTQGWSDNEATGDGGAPVPLRYM